MNRDRTAPPDLAILLAELGRGGVGKARVHLANELVARGLQVDLVLADPGGPYRPLVDERVQVHVLDTTHALFGISGLARYLRRRRPRVLLVQRIRVQTLAVRARALSRVPVRIYVTADTNLSRHFASMQPAKAASQFQRLARDFPRADGVLANSRGVASDLAGLLGWPVERIPVVPNPVVTPAFDALSREAVDHPWLNADDGKPVVLGIGRLEPQKDFATLLHAFARLTETTEARLIILGEGHLRTELVSLADSLGIAERVDLPGFVTNPYAWLKRADLFVLSSAWEGLANVLVEALALGTPVVATDCPSGPGEVLQHDTYGPLIPVGDPETMADAMLQTLTSPPDPDYLRQAATPYSVTTSADCYIQALGLDVNEMPPAGATSVANKQKQQGLKEP